MKQVFFFRWFLLFGILLFAESPGQYISVDTSYTIGQIMSNFAGNNSACITLSNAQITGWDRNGEKSYGYFNRGSSSFDLTEGIILSTGLAKNAEGPKGPIQSFQERDWPGDRDLDSEINGITVNATALEFDFVSHVGGKISFDYMFLSEEFYIRSNGQPNCSYTDAVAFYIKKAGSPDNYSNFAYIPNTNLPVTVPNISCNPDTAQFFGGYIGQDNPTNSPTNFNGQSTVMSAVTQVEKGVTYHIKIVIADDKETSNNYYGAYDSAVFLKAGSFKGQTDLGMNDLIADGTALCEGSTKTLTATRSTTATDFKWYKDGVLQYGQTNPTFIVSTPGKYEVVYEDSGCTITGEITIEYADEPIFKTGISPFCNYNDGKAIPVHLPDYNTQILANYQHYFKVEYSLDSAFGNLLPDDWTYTADTEVFVRVSSGKCAPKYGKIEFRTPVVSTTLKDQTACPGGTAVLDAGLGFVKYEWFNENDLTTPLLSGDAVHARTLTTGIGNYIVRLIGTNGCSVDQPVKVTASEQPVITHVEVNGSTATVFVTGGTGPYEYSLDSTDPALFQPSPTFTNVPRGTHTVYVKSGDGCYTVQKDFLIINLINVLTPNGDGYNDVLDYSDLSTKENTSIRIFDSYGRKIFQSAPNQYIWNGKNDGRPVSTGTYWYILEWTEPFTEKKVSYSGWILVKNRN